MTYCSRSSIILSSTKLAISKWTPRRGDAEDRRSARRERRASRSPGVKKGTGGKRREEIQTKGSQTIKSEWTKEERRDNVESNVEQCLSHSLFLVCINNHILQKSTSRTQDWLFSTIPFQLCDTKQQILQLEVPVQLLVNSLSPVSSYLTGRGSYPSSAGRPPPAGLVRSLWVSQQTPTWSPGTGYGHRCGWYTCRAEHSQVQIL